MSYEYNELRKNWSLKRVMVDESGAKVVVLKRKL